MDFGGRQIIEYSSLTSFVYVPILGILFNETDDIIVNETADACWGVKYFFAFIVHTNTIDDSID